MISRSIESGRLHPSQRFGPPSGGTAGDTASYAPRLVSIRTHNGVKVLLHLLNVLISKQNHKTQSNKLYQNSEFISSHNLITRDRNPISGRPARRLSNDMMPSRFDGYLFSHPVICGGQDFGHDFAAHDTAPCALLQFAVNLCHLCLNGCLLLLAVVIDSRSILGSCYTQRELCANGLFTIS